jgi:hypothetical protein
MLAEYWRRRLGIIRHVVTHTHEYFEKDRDTLATEASPAMATRLSIDEQEAIPVLIAASATAEYEVGLLRLRLKRRSTNRQICSTCMICSSTTEGSGQSFPFVGEGV